MLTPRFEDALTLAARLHAPQVRKGTDIPYVAHLLGVASLALGFGASEDEAIAALLHDAIEDGPENTKRAPADLKAEIASRFGGRVLGIVVGCTDAEPQPGEEKLPWARRKQAYLAHVPTAEPSVRLVAAADKLHGARAILLDHLHLRGAVFARFGGGKEGTLWYDEELARAFGQTDDGRRPGYTRLVTELARTVETLKHEARVGA